MKIILFTAIAALLLSSCKKENGNPEENENELITTVKLTAVERGTANTKVFTWTDLDGEGGNNPDIDNIVLEPSKVYDVVILLLDETKNPVDDITGEVREESAVHRFYYQPSGNSGITVTGLDNDDNGVPVGISSVWTTAATGSGTIKIILRHYANGGKEATDLVSSEKSSTDAEAEFTVSLGFP